MNDLYTKCAACGGRGQQGILFGHKMCEECMRWFYDYCYITSGGLMPTPDNAAMFYHEWMDKKTGEKTGDCYE